MFWPIVLLAALVNGANVDIPSTQQDDDALCEQRLAVYAEISEDCLCNENYDKGKLKELQDYILTDLPVCGLDVQLHLIHQLACCKATSTLSNKMQDIGRNNRITANDVQELFRIYDEEISKYCSSRKCKLTEEWLYENFGLFEENRNIAF